MSRLARTVLLGSVAAGLGIWWLGDAYDIENSRLVGYLVASALLVVGCIGLAAVTGVLLGWLRRRRGGAGAFAVRPSRRELKPNSTHP